jgi:Zn-dependent M16 (insulinase) family peptidase
MSPLPSAHPAFRPVRQETIESLNLRVEQFEHRQTGAMHYHLAADNSENVFLVALRTVPEDSTGVAHILEHTALCGSERFPVRDPFFMMLRRSLNTFMNAFTSSDWTAYPFASQNRKDFNNLLEVYLDAVFFARLDPLDFAQEGHRVEFAEPDNPDSELLFKGVVFNEMKGAMSSVTSVLWDRLCHNLFPTSTYHYNSGGDPERIPDLSYEQLQEFYRTHYHPSNAIFMTFGDIPASEHQAVFESRALARFDRLDERIEVTPEQRMDSPLRVAERYALDDDSSVDEKTHVVMGWMLGESTDLRQMLEAQLLSSVLLENSASPLQHMLETTDLGQAPSPLCGLEDSMRELVFCCGIEGSEPDRVDAFEAQVLAIIRRVADEGVPLERLEAILNQLELHQREISGDSYPYGLQLILQALGCATHYSDPIAVLSPDGVIAEMRRRIADPAYIRDIARSLLLDNRHRVTLVMTPDTGLSATRLAAEKERLARMRDAMDAEQRSAVVRLAADLQRRQAAEDDPGVLPKVELSDVPASLPELSYTEHGSDGLTLTTYGQGTNGLVYQQVVLPLPALSDEQLGALPYYTNALTELGLGDDSYLETQHRQSATVGSINAFTSMRGSVDDEQSVRANLVLSSKALWRYARDQSELLYDTLHRVRFDEADRIRDLVSQQRARREQALTGNGHGLAMSAACAGMSPLAALNHRLSGLEGIRSARALDQRLREPGQRRAFAGELAAIHTAVGAMPVQLLGVMEAEHTDELAGLTLQRWGGDAAGGGAAFEPAAIRESRRQLWVTNTQINFCARAYPTVAVQHPDAAALTVLGAFLRNGFLHRAVREQGGAYGGGASQDSGIAAFRFYSYRDPRIEGTLADFDSSMQWMLETRHQQRPLEEAILGVIGSLDKPSSPAGEAKQHFHNRLFGRDHAHRELFRQRVLAVTLDDLRRVAETYLRPEAASTAVITSPGTTEADPDLAARLGLEVQRL